MDRFDYWRSGTDGKGRRGIGFSLGEYRKVSDGINSEKSLVEHNGQKW